MKIKAMRKAAHITQAKLAKEAAVSLITIGRYERGERKPSLDTAAKIAKALGCKVDDLIE